MLLLKLTTNQNKAYKRKCEQLYNVIVMEPQSRLTVGGRRGRDRMLVGFTTTCTCEISAFHH